jgi:pilus assembly protein CpaC
MTMKSSFVKMLSVTLVIGLLSGLSVVAQGAGKIDKTVSLTVGRADTLDLGQSVADVLVANPAVADVGTLRSSRLYIVGKTIGDTNVLAFDDQGNQLADISVRVRADEKTLKDAVREFFPGEDVEVKTVREDIILRGDVSTPAVANQVRDLASRFASEANRPIVDLMHVKGEQQVMLKVKVIEAQRRVLREYGINTSLSATGGRSSLALAGATALTAPFATGSVMMDPGGPLGPLTVGLQALERDGLVNTLAEPNLTAISGETAGFLAGGEFPVPVGRDQDGNVTIEFKEFGVALDFTPTVMSKDRISLQLSTEVSARSDEDGLTLIGTRIPGLTVRRADTTVQMASGGTLMIAGLIKSDTLDSFNGLPGVKDVPILGELFKSKSFSRGESELIIVVTPYIVKPYAEAVAIPVQRYAEAQDIQPVPAIAPETSVVPVSAQMPRRHTDDALSRSFMHNLKSVYGKKATSNVGNGASYGYIVD